jgi:hypothetical protein
VYVDDLAVFGAHVHGKLFAVSVFQHTVGGNAHIVSAHPRQLANPRRRALQAASVPAPAPHSAGARTRGPANGSRAALVLSRRDMPTLKLVSPRSRRTARALSESSTLSAYSFGSTNDTATARA